MAEILSFLLVSVAVKVTDPIWWAFAPIAALLAWRGKWLLLAAATGLAIVVNVGSVWALWGRTPQLDYAWFVGSIVIGFVVWAVLIGGAIALIRSFRSAASSP
ncbi:hypothetical protein IB276_11805 [Ensifer sp. ENS04]|uniref:hypothetical protein n=1 Tax=Ensifer sp. ENS04 TaxID=2769281 RepID=UPI001783A3EC|nr:hypothetical protein [Ensifer sp. ENS04]MBD9540138.1 hypothetical protein [Ensifer sp. ENS04]